MKKICIFGSGGFAKEVFWLAKQCNKEVEAFIDISRGTYCCDRPIELESYFNPSKHTIVVAVGNGKLRREIADKMMKSFGKSIFETLISPSANLMGNIKIGYGSVICANCIITCDIELGNFAQLNLATTIGHDTKVGDFFTTAPGVHISGNVKTGDCVYFGTNSSTIEHISICSDVIVGAAACVTKNISTSGTYIGVPAKLMEQTNGR